MKLKFKKPLNEAKTIDDEYSKDFKDIDRNTFNTIIALDPETNIETNRIGRLAKQLLLRLYRKGDVEFLQHPDEITKALSDYLANFKNYPATARNVMNFSSIKQFTDFIQDPTQELEVNSDNTTANKLTIIHDKYYSYLSMDDFNYIVKLDSKSSDNSIGEVAKNLLLRVAKDTNILKDIKDNESEIIRDIDYYYTNSEAVKQLINIGSCTLDDFLKNSDPLNTPPSSYVEEAFKETAAHNISQDDLGYIGSSQKYDVFIPKNQTAAAIIAGTSAGNWSSDNKSASSYSNNKFGHWCTTSGSFDGYTGNHRGSYSSEYEGLILVDIMHKFKRAQDDRKHNYQFSIDVDGKTYLVCNGTETSKTAENAIKELLAEDPTVISILAKTPNFSQRPDIQKMSEKLNTAYVTTFVYDGNVISEDDKSLLVKVKIPNNVKKILPDTFSNCSLLSEVILEEGVEVIGPGAFKNCTSLKHIKLPESLTGIYSLAFANSGLIGTISIPKNVNYWGNGCFFNTDVEVSFAHGCHLGKISKTEADWIRLHGRYRKATNEELDEELLTENIPHDLLIAYRNLRNGDCHSSSDYNFRDTALQTRSDLYRKKKNASDIHNASYKEISVEKAIALCKQSKQEAATRLRLIFKTGYGENDLGLGKFEVNDKGQLYLMIRPSQIDRTGESANHKSVSALLQYAVKIYDTNEYTIAKTNKHSPEELIPVSIPVIKPNTDANYNVHGDKVTKKVDMNPLITDTGAHYNASNVSWDQQHMHDYREQVKELYRKLRTLERYKDEYPEEDYNTLKQELKDKIKEREAKYAEYKNKINTGKLPYNPGKGGAEHLLKVRKHWADLNHELNQVADTIYEADVQFNEILSPEITSDRMKSLISGLSQKYWDNIKDLRSQLADIYSNMNDAITNKSISDLASTEDLIRIQTAIDENKKAIADIPIKAANEIIANAEESAQAILKKAIDLKQSIEKGKALLNQYRGKHFDKAKEADVNSELNDLFDELPETSIETPAENN